MVAVAADDDDAADSTKGTHTSHKPAQTTCTFSHDVPVKDFGDIDYTNEVEFIAKTVHLWICPPKC